MDAPDGVPTPTIRTSSPGISGHRWLAREGLKPPWAASSGGPNPRPRDQGAKRANKGGSMANRYLYIVLMFVALITGVLMFYLSNVSLKEMFMT